MGRDQSFKALILRSRQSGESNRLVSLLCAEKGLIEALVYGGPKSKLRSLAVPWHAGRAWVYYDPVKDWYKLSDFDAALTFPSLRASLAHSIAASLMTELVLRTRASGGDFGAVLDLILASLSALDSGYGALDEALAFIWNFSRLAGTIPHISACARCGEGFSGDAWYALRDGDFICPACIDSGRSGDGRDAGEACHRAPASLLTWLGGLKGRPGDKDLPEPLPPGTERFARDILFSLARRLCEGELNSLAMAAEVL